MLGGLVHAIATVTFGVDQIVSGIAINLIAPGVTRFLSSEIFVGNGRRHDHPVAVDDQRHRPTSPSRCSSPFFEWLNDREWFFISDLAGLLEGFTTDMAWSTFIAWIMIPISAYVLWRTRVRPAVAVRGREAVGH